MATATINVNANNPYNPAVVDMTTIEVELLANAAGHVVIDHDHARVEVTDLCGLESKIEERTILAYARDGMLVGKATPKGQKRTSDAGVRIADRPGHAALYHAALAINARIEDTRKEMWAKRHAAAEAFAKAQAPEGHVAVTFVRSEGDGWIEVWEDADGRELRSPRIAKQVGRSGWMAPEDYRAAIEVIEAARVEEATTDLDANTTPVEVPAEAVAAYRRYRGDAERAWEAEDERAWGLIRQYADAIESTKGA